MRGLFVLLLVGLMVAAVGCSGGGDASTLGQIEDAGVIQFAMSGGYPPFNYYDDQGNLVGFDVDIAREVAKRLEVEFEPVTTNWDGIIVGLLAGQYDGILGSMAITEERKERVSFSTPYYYSGAQLVVQAGSGVAGPQDITSDMRIAVVTGTTFAAQVEEWGATPVYFESDAFTLRELADGDVDGVITDRLVALMAMQEHGYDFTLAGELLYTEEMAVAFRQEDEDLVEAVNQALLAMREDGTYQAISNKWFGRDIGQP